MTLGLVEGAPARPAWGGGFESSVCEESLPALAGGRPVRTFRKLPVQDGRGRGVVALAQPPRPAQARMVEEAARTARELHAIPDDEWFNLLRRAASLLADGPGSEELLKGCSRRLSLTAGLPEARVERSLRTLAGDLAGMEEILALQSPNGCVSAFRSGEIGRGFLWLPAGRHLAVRIPGNFPTINIEWLQALAARRPVLLCAPARDPFTPLLLAESLYAAGLPAGAVSLCFEEAPAFWRLCDQILWPGEAPEVSDLDPRRVKRYHQGRSKAVVLAGAASSGVWTRLARLAMQGCGRICTNVSAVAAEDAAEVAERLAEELARFPVLPLDDPRAMVPAFPDIARATAIIRLIEAALARGARDVSASVTGEPLRIERDGLLFLRPTVLRVDASDPIFGVELPFPFLTVAEVPRSGLVRACRGSLIVSVVGADDDLVRELALEPAIDKVFHGEELDRGYRPADPHEGFLADFLFHKKAVLPQV